MALKPINDVALIEVQRDYKIGNMTLVSSQQKEGIEEGVLIELPEEFPYFASNGWAFEGSLGQTELLKSIMDYYRPLIGKKVFWEAYSERGVEVEYEGKWYVLLKLTKLIGYDDV